MDQDNKKRERKGDPPKNSGTLKAIQLKSPAIVTPPVNVFPTHLASYWPTSASDLLVQLSPSLDRLSKAAQTDVQEVAVSQIQLLAVAHTLVLDQARRSFFWALIAAGVGLLFYVASVTFILLQQSQSATRNVSIGLRQLFSEFSVGLPAAIPTMAAVG